MGLTAELTERLGEQDYPATTEELIESHGTMELEFLDGTDTLGDALGRLAAETYESPEEARRAVYSMLDDTAIGRKHYSDRDPTALGEDGHDQVSL